MVSPTSLLFFLSAIFILTAQAVARPDFLYYFCIHDKAGNNTAAYSSYEANFNDCLFSLSSITEIDHGFYHYAYGQNSDQLYAIGFCRGDVNPDVCRGFLNDAASLLTKRCPHQKADSIGLVSSNRSIHGVVETSPNFFMNSVSASYDFAAGNAIAPIFQTLYALAQCTPDLSEQECNDCLLGTFESIPLCCDGKEGGRVERPSCNIRFGFYPLYNLTTAASLRTSTNTNKREGKLKTYVYNPSQYEPVMYWTEPVMYGVVFHPSHNEPVMYRASIKKLTSRISVNSMSFEPQTTKSTQSPFGVSAPDRSPMFVTNKFVLTVASVVLIISMGIYRSVKRQRKNDGRMNEITRTELDLGSEANKIEQGRYDAVYERYTQIRKKLGTMIFYSSCKKKDGSFVTPINQENEIQEVISQPMLDGSSESDDDALMHSSSSRELDEYKLRYEEPEREVNRQREKISSIQEEVNSLKRQQTQLQQEMEANQRQLEQQIEFLLSQLQIRRDPPT